MDIGAQVEFDLNQFPANLPSKEPPKPKEKKQAPRRVTKAELDAVDQLATASRHQDEIARKTQIVRQVEQYYKRCGDRIDYKKPRGFSTKMTLAELEEVQANVEMDLNAHGGQKYAALMFQQGVGFFQDVTVNWFNPLDLALAGPKADLKGTVAVSEKEWRPIVEELAIKYERWFASGPERRLLMFMASMVMQVHGANTMSDQMQGKEHQPVKAEVKQELDDILGE